MDEDTNAAFSELTKSLARGFSAVAEDIADIRRAMATKDDIAALRNDIATIGGQVADIERDLKQIRRELNNLSEKVENVTGYRKEIDYALERIAAIERHLGISKGQLSKFQKPTSLDRSARPFGCSFPKRASANNGWRYPTLATYSGNFHRTSPVHAPGDARRLVITQRDHVEGRTAHIT